jgi:ABC-type Mn2+/Zn2+ transport system ATPase subunit
MNKEEVVRLEDVWVHFDGVTAQEEVNFSIKQQDFLVIKGPNGGGKTTLLKVILGLIKPSRGKIRIFGHTCALKNIRFGYQSSTHQIVHINATEYNKAHPDEAVKIFARETECDVEKVKESFILEKGESYNHTIRASSHPQIHHVDALSTANGWINCTEFTEANGKCYNDWISAIKLFL